MLLDIGNKTLSNHFQANSSIKVHNKQPINIFHIEFGVISNWKYKKEIIYERRLKIKTANVPEIVFGLKILNFHKGYFFPKTSPDVSAQASIRALTVKTTKLLWKIINIINKTERVTVVFIKNEYLLSFSLQFLRINRSFIKANLENSINIMNKMIKKEIPKIIPNIE